MTGLEFKAEFLQLLGEVGTGYIDPLIPSIISKASIEVIKRKRKQFQLNDDISEDLSVIVAVTAPITPTNATIDVSISSTDAPLYDRFVKILITAPWQGGTLSNYAQERKQNQFTNSYTEGNAMFPRYYFGAGIINIEPANATSCVLTYFNLPITIDITDNTIQIAYSSNMIDDLLNECVKQSGVYTRDPAAVSLGTMEQQSNG